MTQKNALMEWLEQTRRVSKSVDMICMDTIDYIVTVLPYIQKVAIINNKNFFNRFCAHYHKDNPLDLIAGAEKIHPVECQTCDMITKFMQSSIDRCWKGIDMVKIQWLEVVDFMWERPELVNPALIDDYIRSCITEVCRDHVKQNPLVNGMWEHFGKHWIDENGNFQEERRKRL